MSTTAYTGLHPAPYASGRRGERVYAELGMPVTPAYHEVLVAAQRKAATAHETTHRYSLEEFGLRADAFNTRLADLFARFHWDEAAPDAAPPEARHHA